MRDKKKEFSCSKYSNNLYVPLVEPSKFLSLNPVGKKVSGSNYSLGNIPSHYDEGEAVYFNKDTLKDNSSKSNDVLVSLNKSDFSLKFKEIFMKKYFPKSIKTISDSEILAKVNNYEIIFRNLCIQYAKKLKKFLERDYIGIVFESENFLSKLFGSFRVDKALKSILVRNESNTISPKKIGRMIKTIRSVRDNENYNYKKKLAFKRILDFLHRYLRFSNNFYRNGINTIFSQLHFKDPASEKLVPRSWLIENLRNVFPKIFEIPLNNIFLTFYLFGDLPIDNRDTKLIKFLKKDRRYRRPHPYELFSIEYRVNNLTMDDFRYNNIKISQTKLKSLQEKVSYIIFEFIFSNYYDAPYISEETGFGIPVGKYYYVPEYFLIRNLYFIGKNINSSDFLSIDAISNIFGLNKNMGDYMTTGCGLGVENLEKIENVIKDLNLNESYKILFEIERFKQSYFKRQEILSPLLGFSSYFQMNLHNFIEKYLNIKFSQDRPIQYITGSSYVYNNKEIQIPCGLHFDGYARLDARFRDKIGLSHIWQGIAFEAHGTWHKDKKEFKERWGFTDEDWRQRKFIDNELKPDICKEKGIIFIIIFEDLPEEDWLDSIIKQINGQTGLLLAKDIFPLIF